MRKPVLIYLIAFSVGIKIQNDYNATISHLIIAIAIILTVIFAFVDRKAKLRPGSDLKELIHKKEISKIVLLIVSGMLVLALSNTNMERNTPNGQEVNFTGEIQSIKEIKNDYHQFEYVINRKTRLLATVYGKWEDYEQYAYRKVELVGNVEESTSRRNPGCFDYKKYLETKRIQAIVVTSPEKIVIKNVKTTLREEFFSEVFNLKRNYNKELIASIGKKKAGIALAMLFGEKDSLDEEVYEKFQKNGTAHILAVSGLHVGIVYAFIIMLLGGKRRIWINIFAILLLVIYASFAEFTPSVTRAVFMLALHCFSKIFHLKYDILSVASAVAFFIILNNPYQLFNLSFQLSYLAIFSLAVIMPACDQKIRVKNKAIKGIILPIVSIQLGMALFTVFTFNYFSIGAFIANIPIIFIVGFAVPVGIVAVIISVVCSKLLDSSLLHSTLDRLFDICTYLLSFSVELMERINAFFYRPGITSFQVKSPSILIVGICYVLIFFLCSEMGRLLLGRAEIKKLAKSMVALSIMVVLFFYPSRNQFTKADMVFVDVGQGDCLHIRTGDGANVLVDGGGSEKYDVGKKILLPYLLKNKVNCVDLAIVSHLDTDHYDGIVSLAKRGMVRKIAMYAGNIVLEKQILEETDLSSDDIIYLKKGDNFTLPQRAKRSDKLIVFEILAPERKSKREYEEEVQGDNENPRSLIIKISQGNNSLLMTGDIDDKMEEQLLSNNNKQKYSANILKVAHHGSKYGTTEEFLNAVNPQYALFLVGKNNYGHPSPMVLDKINKKGIMSFRTDQQGAIGIFDFAREQEMKIRTEI
ncbi:MAG: DNA internalization-related competence protein ComEC/Rec2 [Anaerovoracaceae bacterium]